MKRTLILFYLTLGICTATKTHAQGEATSQFLSLAMEIESNERQEMPPSLLSLAKEVNTTEGYYIIAYLYRQQGSYSPCINFCEKCMEVRPLCFSAILLRGLSLYQLGKRLEGLEDIVLALDPDQCNPTEAITTNLDAESERNLIALGEKLASEHFISALKRITNNNK